MDVISGARTRWAIGLVLLLSSLAAHAIENITEAEVQMLPPYCKDTMTFNGYGDSPGNMSPRAPYWVSLMGKGFWGMHHYCWALISLARAERLGTSKVMRRGYRESAVGDIGFAINYGMKQSGMKFVMLPELFYRRGQILASLGRSREAIESYEKAIEAKKDYWPAYAGLADYYETEGNAGKALQIVEQGLAQAPDSKTLNRMRAELASRAAARKTTLK